MTRLESQLPSPRTESPQTWQTVVSLLVFVHLFFVLVALSGTFLRSGLTATLLDRFAFYTRFLNLDSGALPYYLTHGTEADVDQRIEVQVAGQEEWVVLPGKRWHGSDAHHRYQRYAAVWSQAVDSGDPALFAQAIGTHFSRQLEQAPNQVRCRKHFQLAREDLTSDVASDRDPEDPSRFAVDYAARTILNPDRSVAVIRIEDASQVAAPVSNRSQAAGAPAK